MTEMMTIEKYMQEISCEGAKSVEWINSYRADWMSDNQWLLSLFLCRLFGGFHHCPEIKEKNCGNNSVTINTRTSYFANYDYDYLTKMVVMAHNWGVRVSVAGGGPGMLKISLWKRHSRDGDICDRMPTIDHMIEKYRDF